MLKSRKRKELTEIQNQNSIESKEEKDEPMVSEDSLSDESDPFEFSESEAEEVEESFEVELDDDWMSEFWSGEKYDESDAGKKGGDDLKAYFSQPRNTNNLILKSSIGSLFYFLFFTVFLEIFQNFHDHSLDALYCHQTARSEQSGQGKEPRTRLQKARKKEREKKGVLLKESRFPTDSFALKKEFIKKHFSYTYSRFFSMNDFMFLISTFFASCFYDKKSLRNSLNLANRGKDAHLKTMGYHRFRVLQRIFFSPSIFGDKIVSDRLQHICSLFNKAFVSLLPTIGIHFDETIVPIKSNSFPHRFKIFNKPNPIGWFVHSAIYFSDIVFYLKPRFRNRYRRETPSSAKYIITKLKYSVERILKYSHRILFVDFLRLFSHPQTCLVVLDKLYASRDTVKILAKKACGILLNLPKRCFPGAVAKIHEKRISIKISDNQRLFIARVQDKNKQYYSNLLFSGESFSALSDEALSQFYTSTSQKMDSANSSIIQALPRYRTNWAMKFFSFILLVVAFNIWTVLKFRLSFWKKYHNIENSPTHRFLTFKQFLLVSAEELRGIRSKIYHEWKEQMPVKIRKYFPSHFLIVTEKRSLCFRKRGCKNKVFTLCSVCKKKSCLEHLFCHGCKPF